MEKISRKGFLKIAAAAAMSGVTAAGLAACNGASSSSSAAGLYTPGTYSATATGMGTVTVTMTFDANSITDVKVDVSEETANIGGVQGDHFADVILQAQGTEVDNVSGATITSKAIKTAADACGKEAGPRAEHQPGKQAHPLADVGIPGNGREPHQHGRHAAQRGKHRAQNQHTDGFVSLFHTRVPLLLRYPDYIQCWYYKKMQKQIFF